MANRNPPEINAALGPFRLVRYFSYTSLIVMLLGAITLSWAVSERAKKTLLAQSEAYTLLFAENLNRQVFHQFVLPMVVRYGRLALSDPKQFSRLDDLVRNLTKRMGVASVTIFDSRKNIISYSTDLKLVGKEGLGGAEYQKALSGNNNSNLTSSSSLMSLLPGSQPVSGILHTYIPFRQSPSFETRPGNIMGVVQVAKDLSADLQAINTLQRQIIVSSLGIMALLFGILGYIVARGEKIMETRATERLRLEEKLNETKRLATLGKMVASVSHEIKNPLGIIQSTAEILGRRIDKLAPDNGHLTTIIVEETQRLDTIVREFLDFAHPKVLKRCPTQLNEIVTRAANFITPELEQKNIRLEQMLSSNLPLLAVDPEQIYQVLLNILINGLQAMATGGVLTISTEPVPGADQIQLQIKDTGIGMDDEKQTRIFTPFFTDKTRGSGLGLAIAKNIINKHEGSITVDATLGVGSTFTILLNRQ